VDRGGEDEEKAGGEEAIHGVGPAWLRNGLIFSSYHAGHANAKPILPV
jgi:hypothetical protein